MSAEREHRVAHSLAAEDEEAPRPWLQEEQRRAGRSGALAASGCEALQRKPGQCWRTGLFLPDEPKGDLGVTNWTRSPLRLAAMAKNGLADQLGLESFDEIRKVNGQPVKFLRDVKVIIEQNLGKEIEIEVLREEKPRKLRAKVPKSLVNEKQ